MILIDFTPHSFICDCFFLLNRTTTDVNRKSTLRRRRYNNKVRRMSRRVQLHSLGRVTCDDSFGDTNPPRESETPETHETHETNSPHPDRISLSPSTLALSFPRFRFTRHFEWQRLLSASIATPTCIENSTPTAS